MEKKEKMQYKKSFAIVLLVALAIGTFAALPLQLASAADPEMETYAIVDAIPNPVGVGQETLLKVGVLQPLGSVNLGWEGLTLTIVKPDNKTETLGPFKTDSTGSTFTEYVPDQVGKYKITTNFPEQKNKVSFQDMERGGAWILENTTMKASTATMEFIVQEEPLQSYPGHALPSEYWSRPIDPQLREWFSVSGNWVARPDNSLALYNDDAPETAHVLWANELTTGGLMGGLWGDGQTPSSAEGGDAYEGKFPGSVVLNGILYYQRTDSRRELAPAIMAIDLHTGEEWMFRNNTILSFGQILYFDSYNYDGTFSYIWSTSGSTWTAYDPFTGNQQMQITNVPSGTRVYGPSGEILIYQIDYKNGWMALWNSTDCGLQNAVIGTPDYGSWGNTAHGNSLQNKGLNGTNPRSYSWNVTIPKGLAPSSGIGGAALKIYNNDRIVGMQFNQTQVRVWGLSIKDILRFADPTVTVATTSASTIFDQTWAAPSEWLSGSNTIHYTGATNNADNGVIAVWDKEQRRHYGFSVETGKYMWVTDSEHYADAYGWGNAEHTWYFAYGKLYSVGVGGILYAYDDQTGKTAWTYALDDIYNEPVTGENWWGWITLIADNKVYVGTLEHSAEQPMPRGAPQICVNASDGTEIWRVNGMFRDTRWGGNGVIGDSIIATMDTYDQRVYAIGKGPSKTTATAPDVSVDYGKSVVIKGTVTDISPGTARYALTSRFPNGVPVVSDASMSDWMLYLYKQFERPTNATGVPVSIDVIDANGNYRNIGTTTSDAFGVYSFDWTPDIAGKYQVFVTFAGSGGYYPSYAATSFVVEDAPEATPGPTDSPARAADLYFVPAIAGLFVLIIIVLVMLVLLMRKRP